MVFADLFFLFAFLPAFAICYLLAGLAKGNGVKNGVLVFFSLVFYAWENLFMYSCSSPAPSSTSCSAGG